MQPTVQCPKICSAQSDGRTEKKRTAVSCWPDAAPFTRFSLRFTVQESNGVCCVDRDSFQEKREEEESGARSERESKNKKSQSESDFESELQQARGFLAGCIYSVVTTHRGNSAKATARLQCEDGKSEMITGLVKFETCLV